MSESQDVGRSPGQSPPPERQYPSQQREPPSSGHGVNPKSKNKEESDTDIKGLKSNPEGPLDSHLEELSKKKYKNVAGVLHEQ